MLTNPTLEKLHSLRLTGMAQAFEKQSDMPEIDSLSFEERLGLMVDREMTQRENRRLKTRLQKAKLRQTGNELFVGKKTEIVLYEEQSDILFLVHLAHYPRARPPGPKVSQTIQRVQAPRRVAPRQLVR